MPIAMLCSLLWLCLVFLNCMYEIISLTSYSGLWNSSQGSHSLSKAGVSKAVLEGHESLMFLLSLCSYLESISEVLWRPDNELLIGIRSVGSGWRWKPGGLEFDTPGLKPTSHRMCVDVVLWHQIISMVWCCTMGRSQSPTLSIQWERVWFIVKPKHLCKARECCVALMCVF